MSGMGRSVRAFRPSTYSRVEDADKDSQREKLAKLAIYALRAEAGLPLFESTDELPAPAATSTPNAQIAASKDTDAL